MSEIKFCRHAEFRMSRVAPEVAGWPDGLCSSASHHSVRLKTSENPLPIAIFNFYLLPKFPTQQSYSRWLSDIWMAKRLFDKSFKAACLPTGHTSRRISADSLPSGAFVLLRRMHRIKWRRREESEGKEERTRLRSTQMGGKGRKIAARTEKRSIKKLEVRLALWQHMIGSRWVGLENRRKTKPSLGWEP